MVEAMQLDIFKMVMENLNLLIFVAGVICFLTVVITQVTKGLPGLRSIPTDLQVLVLSVVFTLVAYFAYVDMTGFPVTWYFVIAMIVIGFVLALVATKGWTYVADLFWRFQHKGMMQMRTKKNKLLKRGRAVALAAVLFCTLIFGTMAVVPPIRAEAASINGLPINQKLQTINASSRYGNGIKYIVVHYTGAPGSAANNATYFSTGYRGASAHYFVGYSGEVWQSVSDSLAAWSVGGNKYPGTKGGSVYGKCTNYNSINIEMCVRTSGSRSDTSKDWYFENATINSTVKLVQGLMKKYNVPLSRVVRHYDVVGKYCPNPFVLNDDPVTWSSFKSMVAGDKDLPADTGGSVNTSTKPSKPSTGGSVSSSGINVRYQAYVNGQWLPWVTNYNNVSSDGYAGIPCRAITGLKAYTVGSQSAVGNLQYRVHLRGGRWLPWVTDASGKAPNDYAGIYGHVIDGIQVKLVNKPGYHAEVRVQLTDRTGWLSWSSQYSTGADAYAGIYGIGIDRVQIRIVKN